MPAVLVGVALGPIAAKFIDADRWGSAVGEAQRNPITLVRFPFPLRLSQTTSSLDEPDLLTEDNGREL